MPQKKKLRIGDVLEVREDLIPYLVKKSEEDKGRIQDPMIGGMLFTDNHANFKGRLLHIMGYGNDEQTIIITKELPDLPFHMGFFKEFAHEYPFVKGDVPKNIVIKEPSVDMFENLEELQERDEVMKKQKTAFEKHHFDLSNETRQETEIRENPIPKIIQEMKDYHKKIDGKLPDMELYWELFRDKLQTTLEINL